MAMSYATISAGAEGILVPGTDIGARLEVKFTPQTENATVTKAADGITNVGAITAYVGLDGQFEDNPQIPLGLDQGDVVWKVTARAIDKIPGLPAAWTYGEYQITASTTFPTLVDVDVTAITPEDRVIIGEAAVTATEKAAEASGYADAALDSAADAATDADLAAAARDDAELFATGFTGGTATTLAPTDDPTVEVVGTPGAKQINIGIPAPVADDASMTAVATNPASAFAAAQSATFVGKDGDGTATLGAVGYEAILGSNEGRTIFGYYAANNGGSTATTATVIGHAAGLALTSAAGPTLIGYQAGSLVTDADEVTHVGSYAGWYASGDGNTSLGSRALCGPNSNVPAMTGEKNTVVGVEAGSTISTGSRNTYIGWEAGGGAGNYVPITGISVSGTTVTVTCADTGTLAVGMPLLIENVVGFSANSPNGYGRVVTEIVDSTHFKFTQNPAPTGTYTSGGTWLGGSVTGNDNVAAGHLALFTNQRGSSNIGIGSSALTNLENASNNVAVGGSAMNLATTASKTVAVGHQAAFGITTGTENVFVGLEAGYTATPANKTTTGTGQTHVGYQAGQGSTTQAVQPTTLGYKALTTGHYGTAVGATATAGPYGTAIGRGAVASGQGSVAIGVDGAGGAASATGFNEFVLGTANHIIKTPGRVETAASASGGAKFKLPHGTAPSSPIDGDMWTTTAGLYVRINGATIGPLS